MQVLLEFPRFAPPEGCGFMLRANSGVWVTALGEETVKNCHLFDPVRCRLCLSHGGVWRFRSPALELSTTEVLSEQHESRSLKTKFQNLLISYGLLHKIFEETPVRITGAPT